MTTRHTAVGRNAGLQHDRTEVAVSIVIPAYGACPHLSTVVAALNRQTVRPKEILLIHTGPNDPTDALSGQDDRLDIYHQDDRLYAGAARNLGIKRATGDWIAFLDSDVIPVENWLEVLHLPAEADPERFVVGSIGYAGTGGYWGLSLWMIEFSSVHPYMPERAIQGGASANMLVPTAAARAVGGFPADFAAAEDVVFGAALRARGLVNWFCPAARVDHMNIAGFAHFRDHVRWLGCWSGYARGEPGVPMRRTGGIWASMRMLWAVRMALLIGRLLRWGHRHLGRTVLLSGGILYGLILWDRSFSRGLARHRHQQSTNDG